VQTADDEALVWAAHVVEREQLLLETIAVLIVPLQTPLQPQCSVSSLIAAPEFAR